MTTPLDVTTAPLLAAALGRTAANEGDLAWSALPDAPVVDDNHDRRTPVRDALRALVRRLRPARTPEARRPATPALR